MADHCVKPAIAALCACLLFTPASALPGKHYEVSPADLPAPHSTHPDDIDASFVSTPAAATPQVPEGFAITAFATGLPHPRALAVAPDGDVFVVEEGPGTITRLRDTDGDGKADRKTDFAAGFHTPHGIAIRDGQLYIADTMAVWRAPYLKRDSAPASAFTRVTLAPDLRPDGWHATRHIAIDSRGRIYLSIGGKDDLSEAQGFDASIQIVGEDGTLTPFATGLRNVEGMAFYPGTDDLWITVDERDKLGARLPPDYLAHARLGDFFGWPYAYAGKHPDPVYGPKHAALVAKTKAPDLLFEAHSAPLGLVFYTGKQFPPDYRGDAFVAFHGSGPYDKPDGYKVVRVRFKNGRPVGGYDDFITGFANAGVIRLSVWGTPCQLAVARDGSLLVADDKGRTIWRVAYTGKP
jgi:glucose/arabinose dehydrogenase